MVKGKYAWQQGGNKIKGTYVRLLKVVVLRQVVEDWAGHERWGKGPLGGRSLEEDHSEDHAEEHPEDHL